MSKLLPIAELIKGLLEKEFDEQAGYTLECKKDWLRNIPVDDIYSEFWVEISDVYKSLIDNKWSLDEIIDNKSNSLRYRKAKMDIWFDHPYNFICEFDEKQHFNQYRLVTLEEGYDNLEIAFDYNQYIALCKNSKSKPGTSGFDKLKSKDILFPEMLLGEKQDNRTRQRAFRDYLKDIVPVRLGNNPTVRISYMITNGRIKDFTEEDLENVRRYLYSINFFSKIRL